MAAPKIYAAVWSPAAKRELLFLPLLRTVLALAPWAVQHGVEPQEPELTSSFGDRIVYSFINLQEYDGNVLSTPCHLRKCTISWMHPCAQTATCVGGSSACGICVYMLAATRDCRPWQRPRFEGRFHWSGAHHWAVSKPTQPASKPSTSSLVPVPCLHLIGEESRAPTGERIKGLVNRGFLFGRDDLGFKYPVIQVQMVPVMMQMRRKAAGTELAQAEQLNAPGSVPRVNVLRPVPWTASLLAPGRKNPGLQNP